jgi:hypothetical protein
MHSIFVKTGKNCNNNHRERRSMMFFFIIFDNAAKNGNNYRVTADITHFVKEFCPQTDFHDYNIRYLYLKMQNNLKNINIDTHIDND